jgi:hypothetical protein
MIKSNQIKFIFTVTSLVISCFSHANERYVTLVDLPQSKVQIQTTQPIRLSAVLQEAKSRTSFGSYSEGNKLFNLNNQAQIERIKQESIQSLNTLMAMANYERLATSLLAMVKSKHYAYRELISLDLDQIRLDSAQDPLLSGHYQLSMMPRPKTIAIVGAITEPTVANYSPELTVMNYLQLVTLRQGSSKSYAWVISPQGHSVKVGTSYWNNEHTAILPGSIIFVGLEESLNSDLPNLEPNLITLLKSTQEML